MNSDISAYISAGGKSRRFGRDKSQYILGNKPIIQHVYEALAPVFKRIYIISNSIDNVKLPDVPAISDIIPQLGPIGGLYTALDHAVTDKVFITACDMPFLNTDFISYMVSESPGFDIVVPVVKGYFEPLHAIYSQRCLKYVKEQIGTGNYKIFDIYNRVRVREITEKEIRRYEKPERLFLNINYLEDLDKIEDFSLNNESSGHG